MSLLNLMSYRSKYSSYFIYFTFFTDAHIYLRFLDDCYFSPFKGMFLSIVYYDILSITITIGVIFCISFLVIKKIY